MEIHDKILVETIRKEVRFKYCIIRIKDGPRCRFIIHIWWSNRPFIFIIHILWSKFSYFSPCNKVTYNTFNNWCWHGFVHIYDLHQTYFLYDITAYQTTCDLSWLHVIARADPASLPVDFNIYAELSFLLFQCCAGTVTLRGECFVWFLVILHWRKSLLTPNTLLQLQVTHIMFRRSDDHGTTSKLSERFEPTAFWSKVQRAFNPTKQICFLSAV